MRLKHLQLQGYKTFAAKTEFLFPSGITAIVGPNGSGKSNITDAIRWVLGEQSYTTLRGKRTEDMIFSGSQSRPRAGMAEVILTLDNSDNWLPVEFSEVTVGRRAYRDGQNEYRINNSRVRLRDVSELLSQSGLSRRTYTIIGQGVVDAVLSLRAQERRELFEEAAGIAHYRDKRADALRRLDETQRNLERVHDIITEIEPRLERLKLQAERTQEHADLSAHLERLLRTWYGYQWGQAATALNQAQRIARQRSDRHYQRLQSLQALIEDIDQTRQAQSHLRRQLGDWHHQSSILHSHAEETQRELAVLAERSRQLAAQRQEHLAEIATLDARGAAQTDRVAQTQADLATAQQALTQRQKEVDTAQAALDTRVAERKTLQEILHDTREQHATLRTNIAQRQSRLETLAERSETQVAQIQTNQVEINRLKGELNAQSSQITRIEAQLSQLSEEEEQARGTLDDLVKQRQALTEQLKQEQTDLLHLREGEAEIAARFELLSELRRDFAIYGQAARTLLTARGSAPGMRSERDFDGLGRDTDEKSTAALSGIKGILAQMIQVAGDHSPEVSTAIEAALGVYAGAIVVKSWRVAAAALRHLRSSGVDGRVIFLALEPHHDWDSAPSQSIDNDVKAQSLSSQVRCDDTLRPLVNRLLGRAYLVANLDTAHSTLPRLAPGALCVTPEGDVLRSDGAIEGGRPTEQTSPLAQEREWSQLHARRIQLGTRREALEGTVARTNAALEKIQKQMTEGSVALDELRVRVTAAATTRDQFARHTDRLRQEIEWRQSQMVSAEADLGALRQRQNELTHEITELSQAQSGAADKIQKLTANLETLTTRALSEELTAAQAAFAAAQQTCQGQETILHELEITLDHLGRERQTRHNRVAELKAEEKAVAERTAQLNQDQAEVTAQLEALKAQIEPAESRLTALEKEQNQLETTERLERARLREFEGHLTTARLEVQRCEDGLAQLRNRIEEDMGLVELELGPSFMGQTPLPLHPLVSKLPIVRRLPEGLEDEMKRLRAQLRRLGAVNPNAPLDYRELLERHSFLQEQSSDLTDASDSLRSVIAEMDSLIEHAFRQTFQAVASEFSKTFTALFDGGHARLELTDSDDLSQTGVEIVAQPPGKRLQALASLSGGERALTAVALIFSILKVSPTPFCILDEVDAMLDEANIARFRAMLESLTNHTQFVIITHNRGTITAADTVYGVSMGADSVSQVYSIQMEGEKIKREIG